MRSIRAGQQFYSWAEKEVETIAGTRSSFARLTAFLKSILHRLRRKDEPMAKSFRILQAKMTPKARARSQALAKRMMADMALGDLRRARVTTQAKLGKALKVNQAAVSKLERRTDMYISTLRSYVEAMGGRLDIIARFNEGSVRIAQFEDVGSSHAR